MFSRTVVFLFVALYIMTDGIMVGWIPIMKRLLTVVYLLANRVAFGSTVCVNA